jgi:hypothetical protein
MARLMVVFACAGLAWLGPNSSTGAAGTVSPTRTGKAQPASAAAALEGDLAQAISDADIVFDNPYHAVAPSPWTRAKSEWRRRISACPNDRCRAALTADQLNRIRFGLGERNKGSAPLPWQRGDFSLDARGVSGTLNILPAIDDRLSVSVDTLVSRGTIQCGLIAEGRWTRDGQIALTPADDAPTPVRLVPRGTNAVELLPSDHADPKAPLCGPSGFLYGVYKL